MTSLFEALAVTLLAASLQSPAAGQLEVRGPENLELVATDPVQAQGCAAKIGPGLFRFSCQLPRDAQLTFARPGWEPRVVRASRASLDLRDDAWVPSPWAVRLSPPELAAGARVVWLAEEGVERATPVEDGQVQGPRVIPGHVGVMAVVGPNTAGTFLKVRRPLEEQPLEVTLTEGRSVALVCREPWTWRVVADCRVVVGKPSPLLRGAGLARVRSEAHVEGDGGLFLVAGYGEDAIAFALADELPPFLDDLAEEDGVVEVVFPRAHRLRVTLAASTTGKPVADGTIRIVALPHEVLLVEEKSDARGRVEVAVGAGRVRVVAEARGFRRGEVELDIVEPRENADLALEATTVLRGQVWDERGQPVGGVLVIAAGQDLRVDGTGNLAATGGDGAFEVTAPGAGPWWVWAQADGSTSARVLVHRAEERVSLRLARECSVAILPIDTAGNVYPVQGLTCTGLDRVAIRLPEEGAASGAVRFRLSPGRWRVWAEEEGLSGHLEVPDPCEGVLLPVVLTPRPGQP